ncbi:hypothetical protein MNBD_GAMMA12-3137 [hydrothermal vent metagenome]|uniref:Uncharacterized protein n=1 Tax=hydrothermal vent metagenome TaxID=652676 RepID=A0A3B0YG40_9ZZZZ
MLTFSKQRLLVGLVFSFFLTIGFSASLLLVSLSSNESSPQIANKASTTSTVAKVSDVKQLKYVDLQVNK